MVAPARPRSPARSEDAPAPGRRRIGLRAQPDLVDEIGTAVAAGRDLEAIIRLVGERVGALFHVRSVAMALYDEARGQILLSQRAFAAVEDLVVGESIGEVSLKGFSRPVPVHNVVGLREEPATTAR